MAGNLLPSKWSRSGRELPAPKRISTPAGMRLSTILNDSGISAQTTITTISGPKSPTTPKDAPRLSFSDPSKDKPQIRVVNTDLEASPKASEKSHLRSPSPSPPYTQSEFSEKSKGVFAVPEISPQDRHPGFLDRLARRRILVVFGILLVILLAIIIGLAVGLTRKSHKQLATATTAEVDTTPSSSSPTKASPTVPIPSNFPLGSYSIHTFLDTVQSNCTSVSSSWTCSPDTTFYSDTSKSLATFSYSITGSAGSYRIAPSSNISPFGNITFTSTALTLINPGKSTENYRFHVTINKAVETSIDGKAATCSYSATTFQGYLYTKMGSDYPLPGQQVTTPTDSQIWPYAVRFEQVAGGGSDVPKCVEKGSGAPITKGIAAQDPGSLCSCLYKNWRTPMPS